jgi:hypothetical protein
VRPDLIVRLAKTAFVYETPSISTSQTGVHWVMRFAG